MTRFQKYQKNRKEATTTILMNYKVMLETTIIKRTSFSDVIFLYTEHQHAEKNVFIKKKPQ